MSVHRSDILWKAALEDFFDAFLRFFFKDADTVFDFDQKLEFLDQELAELSPAEDVQYPKRIDKLVKVFTRRGEAHWILAHIEVQGYPETGFTRRMYRYYSRLADKYDVPITCMVIFLGRRSRKNNSCFELDYLGTSVKFQFNAYHIGDQDEESLKKSNNPFAILVLAALMVFRFKKNPQELLKSKIALVKHLLASGLPKVKIRQLLNFIRLYVHFDKDHTELNTKFNNSIKSLTHKTSKMGIMEYAAQVARKEGELDGEKRGVRKGETLGEKKAKISIAKKMKSLGISPTHILKSTGLSFRQIKGL